MFAEAVDLFLSGNMLPIVVTTQDQVCLMFSVGCAENCLRITMDVETFLQLARKISVFSGLVTH